jgi:hypothetical protein
MILEQTRTFTETNNSVSRFAFLMLVLIVFMVLLRGGVYLLNWWFTPKSSPILLNGMRKATQASIIKQDPSVTGAIPVKRSVNKEQGMEFSWSVWLHVDDQTFSDKTDLKHVFHKGNDSVGDRGMVTPNNAPGVYLARNTNDLIVVMNTYERPDEDMRVEGIPMNKWINVLLRLDKQRNLDVYINGTLKKRHVLEGVPKQNYGDVFVTMNGGFQGFVSELRYFDHAVSIYTINSIVRAGPNMSMNDDDMMTKTKPYYLSSSWYAI